MKCPNCGHRFTGNRGSKCSVSGCLRKPTKIYIAARVYGSKVRQASYYRCDKHPLAHAHTVKVFTG